MTRKTPTARITANRIKNDDFFAKLTKSSPKMTLRDHLMVTGGFTDSYHEYQSMKGMAQRRLRAGGDQHHLLGKVIYPSRTNSRGLMPLWAGSTKSMVDTVAEPDWRQSTEIQATLVRLDSLSVGIKIRDPKTKQMVNLSDSSDLVRISKLPRRALESALRLWDASNKAFMNDRARLIAKYEELSAQAEKLVSDLKQQRLEMLPEPVTAYA